MDAKHLEPDCKEDAPARVAAQGSVLALWFEATVGSGFRDHAFLIRDGENAAGDSDWLGPVNIVSWGSLTRVLDKDPQFEFRHCEKNICVTSADLSLLRVGDAIRLGKARLVVLRNGRNCPKQCYLKTGDSEDCSLAAHWISARVLQTGRVCVDDPLLAKSHHPEVP